MFFFISNKLWWKNKGAKFVIGIKNYSKMRKKLRFYSKNVFQKTSDCAVFYDCYSHAKHNSRQSHMFHFINRRLMRLVCVHHAHEFQVFWYRTKNNFTLLVSMHFISVIFIWIAWSFMMASGAIKKPNMWQLL